MLVNVDVKYLDWLAAAYLSQDLVAIREIKEGFDLHSDNQKTFGLSSRLLAKKFLFRIIFGGTAFSFYKDSEFAEANMNLAEWEAVIEKFYRKYKGIHEWHERLVKEATTTKQLSIPTGRSWKFEMKRTKKGDLEWPVTTIKNYVVQGLEADLMMLTRVSLFNRIKHDKEILMINSVHDSILIDCPDSKVNWVCKTITSVFEDVPKNFKRLWKQEFNLPYRGEISYGKDWKNMQEVS